MSEQPQAVSAADLLDELLKRQVAAPTVTKAPPAKESVSPGIDSSKLGLVVVGYLIASVFWIIGARYTIDGVLWIVNWVLNFLTIPARLIIPPHWSIYLVLAPLPYLFSRIEIFNVPRRQRKGRIDWAMPAVVSVWVIVVLLDLSTTFLGLGTPDPTMGQAGAWFSASFWAKGTATIILTFWPEWLFQQMNKQLRKG